MFSLPPRSGSPAFWATSVGVGGTGRCTRLLRSSDHLRFALPWLESPAIRRRSSRPRCRTHLYSAGDKATWPAVRRPSLDQRPTAAASPSRAWIQTAARVQTGPLDPGSTVHVCSSCASACAVVPWPWAVRCKIDGPGSSTSFWVIDFPERFIYKLKKVMNFKNA